MGHKPLKDVYRAAAEKMNGLSLRPPVNEKLIEIIKTLYSEEEADVYARMPFGMATLSRISKLTGYDADKLKGIFERMCNKGLVVDMCNEGEYYYSPSPFVVGVFEFTMMRTGADFDAKYVAGLFHDYFSESVYGLNFDAGQQLSIARAMPHDGTAGDYVEVLDYEKAASCVDEWDRFGIGICSCRHEKQHLGLKKCETPLEVCVSMGWSSDYAVKRGLARKASKEEIFGVLDRSREEGLVISADNVKNRVTFFCNCCGCCCNLMKGIRDYGYANTLVTSTLIAEVDSQSCSGCGDCAEACHIDAIKMAASTSGNGEEVAQVDHSICLGCGVCALACPTGALKLEKRKQRVLHPETTFHRAVLSSLERGLLQNLIFDDPNSITQKALRGIVGAFLKLDPVKRSLMSDSLRSRFLSAIAKGTSLQGMGFLTQL